SFRDAAKASTLCSSMVSSEELTSLVSAPEGSPSFLSTCSLQARTISRIAKRLILFFIITTCLAICSSKYKEFCSTANYNTWNPPSLPPPATRGNRKLHLLQSARSPPPSDLHSRHGIHPPQKHASPFLQDAGS